MAACDEAERLSEDRWAVTLTFWADFEDSHITLSAAKQKKFQIILCKSQSRFTRDMELVEKYIHGLFPIWGIRFIAVANNADTEVKGNKKPAKSSGGPWRAAAAP